MPYKFSSEFNSQNRGSSVAKAGKLAGSKFGDALKTVMDASPNFGEINARSMKADTDVEKAGIQTEGDVSSATIKAQGALAALNTKTKAQSDQLDAKNRIWQTKFDAAKKAQSGGNRMAGNIAAMGAMVYGLARASKKGEVPKPIERKPVDTSRLDAARQNHADLTQQAEDLQVSIDALGAKPNGAAPKPTGDTPKPGGTPAAPTAVAAKGPTAGSTLSGHPLLRMIRVGEGTAGDNGYTTMFTGKQFSDLSRHPAQLNTGGGYTSDAAGAYQYLSTTWKPLARDLGLTDFSPTSQDKGALELIRRRGVDPNKQYTDFESFRKDLDRLAPEWASLPTMAGRSYYGQPVKGAQHLWEKYQQYSTDYYGK